MSEFLAAVHAVRQHVRSGKKSIRGLVSELGIDGDLARFWVFFSGLVDGGRCETLLTCVRQLIPSNGLRAELSRCMLLLLDCYNECEKK